MGIKLTSTVFEVSYLGHVSDRYLYPSLLDPSDTWDWYFRIRNSPSQFSNDAIEKVFFALLHMAKVSGAPTNVIWMFYCLETLFDTKVGENFRVLTFRIGMLLELNPRDSASLKKKLKKLYDFRSSLVHGGQPVIHPMHNDMLDKRVLDHSYEVMRNVDVGYVLILACLQRLVKNRWTSVTFTETMTGTKTS